MSAMQPLALRLMKEGRAELLRLRCEVRELRLERAALKQAAHHSL
jgi:hypothetical protein